MMALMTIMAGCVLMCLMSLTFVMTEMSVMALTTVMSVPFMMALMTLMLVVFMFDGHDGHYVFIMALMTETCMVSMWVLVSVVVYYNPDDLDVGNVLYGFATMIFMMTEVSVMSMMASMTVIFMMPLTAEMSVCDDRNFCGVLKALETVISIMALKIRMSMVLMMSTVTLMRPVMALMWCPRWP